MKSQWLIDNIRQAKIQLQEANKQVSLAELSVEIYNLIYGFTDNDSWSYDIAKSFQFDRFMNSKEFLPDEKEQLKVLIDKYNSIIA